MSAQLDVIEPGAGKRFVDWLNDLAAMMTGAAKILTDPDVQATGAAFVDSFTHATNRELSPVKASVALTITTTNTEEPDHE